ncbi:MAG: pseudouridine synthase [Saprospiraceae bacterium]
MHLHHYLCDMDMTDQNTKDDHYPPCFTTFHTWCKDLIVPERFTYPFNYEPHPLAILASKDLQNYLAQSIFLDHDFGLDNGQSGQGKMFGVLVVQDSNQEIGYLSAFSGKLMGGNHYDGFVPPVFDTMDHTGFYKIEESQTNLITREIEALENDSNYQACKNRSNRLHQEEIMATSRLKQELKIAKHHRRDQRQKARVTMSDVDVEHIEEGLNLESIRDHFLLKDHIRSWRKTLDTADNELSTYETEITRLKNKRRQKSSDLQERLFKEYCFLNATLDAKSIFDIFDVDEGHIPPAGAGECAAPKLLQYAFHHGLKPIAIAEFWWGKSPASEIRRHGQYYPACTSKCKPILTHMLKGMVVDPNPLEEKEGAMIDLPVIYEDEYLVVINKPEGFLSVPGKNIRESVYTQMLKKYPASTGPMIVHRLDMSTSGLMVIAKTKMVHQHLQSQFAKRKIKKRYVAILDGVLTERWGEIDLPIRVDLDHRPRQLVCYQYGKPAKTKWEYISVKNDCTRVYLYPETGRTHQLRVHASHLSGLHTPIKGDELYGTSADRLYLHAEALQFIHPMTNETISLEAKASF